MPDPSMFCFGFLGWAWWVTSAGESDHMVQLDTGQFPVLMRKGSQVWLVQDCLLHTIWSGDALSVDGPWLSILWQCLGIQIVECFTHCMPSVWFTGVESGWLAILSDMSGEQFSKDMK